VRSRPAAALTVLFLANLLNFYDRLALAAVLEPIRREFHLSDTQLGALVTWFTVVFAVAGLPLGRLADTASRRKLLAAGMTVWASLTAATALATSYAMLLATRLGVGIGEAVCAPVAASWIGDLVPAQRRARAMAGFMVAIPIGGMLSYAVTGPVAQAYGWRIALALAAAPVLVLVPAILWLAEPTREAAGPAPGRWPLAPVLRLAAFWWIAASGAVINFALYSFSTFMPAFLTRYHGASVARAGVWTGIGTGVAGLAAAGAVSALGDRVQSRLALAAAVSLAAAVPLFAALLMPPGSDTAAVVLAMAGYGMLQMYYGLIYAAIQDLIAAPLRASAMAAYLVVTYLGGASWGPVVTGWLSDTLAQRTGSAAAGLHGAMFAIPVLAVVLAGILWMAASAAVGDPVNKAESDHKH
jgi:predicted MFS family arabinose efflux permease